jgi:hypothetical protein
MAAVVRLPLTVGVAAFLGAAVASRKLYICETGGPARQEEEHLCEIGQRRGKNENSQEEFPESPLRDVGGGPVSSQGGLQNADRWMGSS